MPETSIIGTWRLVAYEQRFTDGRTERPLGEAPEGYLIYTADGWVSAMLLQGNRRLQDTVFRALWALTPEEMGYVLGTTGAAYQATYSVDGDTVTHHVHASLHPSVTGRDLVRIFSLDGNRLVIKTALVQTPNGDRVEHLEWERVS